MHQDAKEDAVGPRIVRGRVDSLSLYEITDYELQALEDGSIGATYLNFAIFFISMAASFLGTLLTATAMPDRTFTVFVVLVVVGLAAGIVLIVLWFKTRRSMSKVLKRIKDRCVVAGEPVEDAPELEPDPCDESAG